MNLMHLAKRNQFLFLYLLLLCASPLAAQAQLLKARIQYVSDGDTFHGILADGSKLKIRLAEVDCPESTQPYGLEAKEFALKAIRGKEVELRVNDTDRYGRKVARVRYEGKDLSEELVRIGFAWHYKQYSKDQKLAQLELEARSRKLGLWKDKAPVAPWEYRKNKRVKTVSKT